MKSFWKIMSIVSLIILVIIGAWFIYYYSQASAMISQNNTTISSLQGQLSSANNQIASLQNDVSSKNSAISSLQSQVVKLQNIVSLNQQSVIASSKTVNQAAGGYSLLGSFSADYAGFVYISGISTTSNGYIQVTNSNPYYPHNYTTFAIGTSGSVSVPVLPGTVNVYFKNTNFLNDATATMTVTYYY